MSRDAQLRAEMLDCEQTVDREQTVACEPEGHAGAGRRCGLTAAFGVGLAIRD